MDVMGVMGRQTGCAPARSTASAAIIARARGGEEEAFRLIFERYGKPVISFIYDIVGQRELAEELAQETFVRAYKGIDRLRDDTKLSTWLFGIAKNVARESLRSRRRDKARVDFDDENVPEATDEGPLPDNLLLSKELGGVIQRALGALDEDRRLVFSLRIFQQQSYEEIVTITGFSLAKVKTDIHRAKAEMRERIRPYLGTGYAM